MSSVEYHLIVTTKFNSSTNLQLFFAIFKLFFLFWSKSNWRVCNAFFDLFSNLFYLAFSQNCDYLFYLTCKTMKITMKEQRVKRQRKEIVYIYDVRKNFKKSKFRNPTHPLPLSPPSKNIKFWSLHALLPDVFNWHSKSPHPG